MRSASLLPSTFLAVLSLMGLLHGQGAAGLRLPGPRSNAVSLPLATPSNILVVVADDVGVDMLHAYGVGSDLPVTPVIDSLAASGVLFRNAWANPLCSASRATLQTGQYSFRTGVGYLVGVGNYALPLSAITLPEMLDLGNSGYRHAAIGKWHLGNLTNGADLSPNLAGYQHFAGTLYNFEGADTYYSWRRVEDGVATMSSVYATTDQVDSALSFIQSAPEPWFCYLAFSAVHNPVATPPAGLYSENLSNAGNPATNPRPYYKAMLEAMDTEMGRLIAGLGPAQARTDIVFLGDNGTPGEVTVPPFLPDHAKHTLFEGGIKVPLIVSGPAVNSAARGAQCLALVNTTDVFATVAELAGVNLASSLPAGSVLDSVSLVPYLTSPTMPSMRKFVLAETFVPNGPETGLPGDQLRTPCHCQADLGLGGPGSVSLSICGDALSIDSRADLLIHGALPGSMGCLLWSVFNNPTPMLGGTVLPNPPLLNLMFSADSLGEWRMFPVDFTGLLLGYTVFLQALVVDPLQVQGYAISNAVRADFLASSFKAIRDLRYKLVVDVNGNLPDALYDLVADPFELNDLLAGSLTLTQARAHQRLLHYYQEVLQGTPVFQAGPAVKNHSLQELDCPPGR